MMDRKYKRKQKVKSGLKNQKQKDRICNELQKKEDDAYNKGK